MSAPHDVAQGITYPPIDDLLAKTDSKYGLVIYAAKRARQINAYYSQLGEGLLEYVGPLVETTAQEKPLSIALREIDAELLSAAPVEPGQQVDEMGVLVPETPQIDLGDPFADLTAGSTEPAATDGETPPE